MSDSVPRELANCHLIGNGTAELLLATEFGPRILGYRRKDGPNVLGLFPDNATKTAYGIWRPHGGHRLWAAPEAMPFSYAPDDEPVRLLEEGRLQVRAIQAQDAAGIEKEMVISMDATGARVEILHRLTNRTDDSLEMAPWALTIFRGGEALLPLEAFRSHDDALLPSQPLILWPFTELTDSRLNFNGRIVRLRCDPKVSEPLKLGLANRRGWAAYSSGNLLFVKRFAYLPGRSYPDFGANCESYVAGDYLEIESLGPLETLGPNESIQHLESWDLLEVDSEELAERVASLSQI